VQCLLCSHFFNVIIDHVAEVDVARALRAEALGAEARVTGRRLGTGVAAPVA
jgi:hypothetical protein